jgi:lipopolysaccharide export system permease protein
LPFRYGAGSMRLLDRYLVRELMIPLSYCLGGFLVFWISADLMSDLNTIQQAKLGFLEIVEYYFVRTPELLTVVLPVALLLALLYVFTNLTRHHELTAMRAAGLSLWRLCAPYLTVGFLLSLALYALTEVWMPDSLERAEEILKRHTTKQLTASERAWRNDLKFRNDRDERFWRVRSYNVETGEMLDPYVQWRAPDGTRRQVLAARATRTNGVWTFFDARQFAANASPNSEQLWQSTNRLEIREFDETPEQIRSEIKVSQLENVQAAKRAKLSIGEILNYKRLHPNLKPKDRAKLDTTLYARLASPWTCLVVVLIAIPFGAPSGRRNAFVGVAASIFICFTYFVVQRFGLALGTGGYISPMAAAFLPNVLFAGTGIVLTSRIR